MSDRDRYFYNAQGYTVRRLQDRGYLVLGFFGPGFRVCVQDMQLICDVCPLRIDSIFVRDAQDDDNVGLTTRGSLGGGGRGVAGPRVSAVLSICLLDCNQPVRITEAEVVRVRKRSRGVLFSSLFGGGR